MQESQPAAVASANYSSRPKLRNDYVAPNTPTEEKVAKIWQDYLAIDLVGIHDNFLDLGGDSLLATQVIARLREVFSVKLSLASLLETPTVAEIASNIEQMLSQTRSGNQEQTDREEIEI